WSTSKTPSYTKSVSWQHHPGISESHPLASAWLSAKNTAATLTKALGSSCPHFSLKDSLSKIRRNSQSCSGGKHYKIKTPDLHK
ncbi:hypothetical protein, partial [Escherichia coli]|uniref:hypothetical protein n=1 Tax=Escherichia coli TaxID=562 RepID=UPI0019582087